MKTFLAFALPRGIIFSLLISSIPYSFAATFPDVQDHTYQQAIEYLQENDIVQGYPDGSYKPDNAINRAEFTKIVLGVVEKDIPPAQERCFDDVALSAWYAPVVCRAKEKNIISGYPDGNFKPGQNISFVEAAKIIVNTLEVSHSPESDLNLWYEGVVRAMSDRKAIPGTLEKKTHLVTRGEMAEMIMRLKESITNLPSLTTCDFIPQRCEPGSFSGYGDEFLENIDMKRVRETWLGWYNDVRQQDGLSAYVYHNELNRTAFVWSATAKTRGEITHKRTDQAAYYDYKMIQQWFLDLGVQFIGASGYTFVENIGWGPYRCSNEDCTQKLIDNIRSTFDFFMGEKGRAYAPHYDSIVNKYFTKIGLGISLDREKNRYYLTVHYGVSLKDL